MDSYTVVAERLEAGKQFLAALRREGVPVDLVFWHRPEEAAQWSFCVATPLVEQEGMLGAARRIVPVRRSFGPGFALGANDVVILKSSHPLVQDLLGPYTGSTGRPGWEERPLLVNGWEIDSELPQWFHVTRAAPAVATV